MNKRKIKEIYDRFEQANPHPTTELMYTSPFELLIAVLLSAQATDVSVNIATKKLFKVANTPEKMLALSLDELKLMIKNIGLFNTKAVNVLKTCQLLISQYGGEVPQTREALETLPGVGRKTANVVLNTYFGQGLIAVDTHIFRVANRTGLATGDTPLKVELQLMQNTPKQYLLNAHHWLILHGRYTCIARKPKCAQCLIVDLCEFKAKVMD